MDIRSEINHEAIVKTPVHMGTQYDTKSSQSMNRVTGQVQKKTTITEKPIINVMKNVREVTTPHQTMVNISNGKVIDPYKPSERHGLPPQ